jgi:hypothetical protein
MLEIAPEMGHACGERRDTALDLSLHHGALHVREHEDCKLIDFDLGRDGSKAPHEPERWNAW